MTQFDLQDLTYTLPADVYHQHPLRRPARSGLRAPEDWVRRDMPPSPCSLPCWPPVPAWPSSPLRRSSPRRGRRPDCERTRPQPPAPMAEPSRFPSRCLARWPRRITMRHYIRVARLCRQSAISHRLKRIWCTPSSQTAPDPASARRSGGGRPAATSHAHRSHPARRCLHHRATRRSRDAQPNARARIRSTSAGCTSSPHEPAPDREPRTASACIRVHLRLKFLSHPTRQCLRHRAARRPRDNPPRLHARTQAPKQPRATRGRPRWTSPFPPTRTPKSARRCAKLCARFPGEYWRKLDQRARLSHRVRPRPDRSRLPRRADPRGIRRRRPAAVGRRGDPRDHPGRGLQRRRLPRPDVHHGHHPAARHADSRSKTTCRRSPPANCACRRSASPNRPAAPTPPRCAPSPSARATTTSSTARRCGPAARNTPT